MIHILVVEDDEKLNRAVCTYLRANGYEAKGVLSASDAYDAMYSQLYDFIISDIMMPGIDGFAFAKTVRELNKNIPLLFMSARDDLAAKREGFQIGIDDYIVKPFELDELLLRVQALLRRSQMNAEQKCTVGSTTLDYNTFSVATGGVEQILPQKEFLLLFKLVSNMGRAFTRLQLMDDVWGYESETDPHTVDVHIGRLRNRFLNNPDFDIQTIRGMGYRAVKKA